MTPTLPPEAADGAAHDTLVVGASMGGLDALRQLVAGLDPDLPAAVLVVLHVHARSPGALGEILDAAGPLPARLAVDGEALRPGRIYVAPPDHHLLVAGDRIRLTRGPRENRARPAIDPLFRSAAVARRSRVVGVVLTGLLDDGAAGLSAVQRCGGVAVVQDPDDAPHPEMPRNAAAAVDVDYSLPVAEMGPLLSRLAREPAGAVPPVPRDLLIEADLTGQMTSDPERMDELGERSTLSCPECGGVTWALAGPGPKRYRCHIGHAFTEAAFLDGQHEEIEHSLEVALRTMEDRTRLLRTMAREAAERGHSGSSTDFEARAAELDGSVVGVRSLLLRLRRNGA